MLVTALFAMKRRFQREDRTAVLDRHHAARSEAGAIARAIHLVENRHLRIAGAQEIGMQGMAKAPFDRAGRRHQRLAQHLTAENALNAVLGADAAKDVLFDLFQIEQIQHVLDGCLGVHGVHLIGPQSRRKLGSRRNPFAPHRHSILDRQPSDSEDTDFP